MAKIVKEFKNVWKMLCVPETAKDSYLYKEYMFRCKIFKIVQTLEGNKTKIYEVLTDRINYGYKTLVGQLYIDNTLSTVFDKNVKCSVDDKGGILCELDVD